MEQSNPVDASSLILIAQSDPAATASLAYHLAKAGYPVTTASEAGEVMALAAAKIPALLVLDPDLGTVSGYELLERIRRDEQTRELGVILLGASRDRLDGVRGLSLGADDCLAAPISPEEFVLRVAAVLRRRRSARNARAPHLRAGAIVLDRAAHRVTVGGDDVAVTVTEFKLLAVLIESAGRVCSRQQLLESVWDTKGVVQTRTVDMHLQRLRRKLGSAGDHIETVRGAGYRLQSTAQSNL